MAILTLVFGIIGVIVFFILAYIFLLDLEKPISKQMNTDYTLIITILGLISLAFGFCLILMSSWYLTH